MKQLQITAAIETKLRSAFGKDADLSNVVVFEALAVNGLPIRHAHGLYQNARVSEGTMIKMAAHLEKESIPLILNHTTEGEPHGRVFAGQVVEGSLHVLFALNKTTNPATVERLNSGINDQVSVSILAEKAICSECGFDYLGPDADFENLYYGTCSEGHVIGENGVHVRLSGLENFYEMSLVGQGAIPGARIKGPSESVFTQNGQLHRLAAKNLHPTMVVLSAAPTPKDPTMDLEKILAQLQEQAGKLALAASANEAHVARIADLEAQLAARPSADVAALQAEIADLKPKAERLAAVEAELAAAPKADEHKAALDALKEHARSVLIATGDKTPDANIPADVGGIVGLIKEKTAALTALITPGGVSKSSDGPQGAAPASTAAFKTRK